MFESLSSQMRDAPTVLIAEDEVIVRFALSGSLADRGVRVFEAGSAAEAIRVLEREDEIDLVFTDIRMPGSMSGIDLARWVHAHRPGLAVILTSGDVHKAELAANFCEGKPFIAKPYDLDTVVARIADLARENQHGR